MSGQLHVPDGATTKSVPIVLFDGLSEDCGGALIQIHRADLPLRDLRCGARHGVMSENSNAWDQSWRLQA